MKIRLFAWFVLMSVAGVARSLLADDNLKSRITPAPVPQQTNSVSALLSVSPPSFSSTKAKSIAAPELSGWTADVAKLSEAGMDPDIIYSFIDGSGTFNLDADQIIHLRKKGVPSEFIIAMIQHDSDLASGMRPLTISTAPSTRPSIQFVLVPKDSLKERKSDSQPNLTSTSPDENAPAQTVSVYDDVLRFVDGETLSALQNDSNISSTPAPEKTKGFYRVRQPYSEQVTPPILIFKGATVPPNTYLVQFSP